MKYLFLLLPFIGGLYYGFIQKSDVVLRSERVRVQAAETIIQATPTPTPPGVSEVVYEIARVFDKEPAGVIVEAIATFRRESGFRLNAQGWNCYYYKETGERYSDVCKVEDRHKAWSTDCGVAQINVPGKYCPPHLLKVRPNLEKAYEMYKRRGFAPWVANRKIRI